MNVQTTTEGEKLTVTVTGSIDTITAPQLQAAFDPSTAKEIVFDLAGVEYVSSAGIRLFLATHKAMAAVGGTFTIVGASPAVANVIRITGFSQIFHLT